MDKFIAKLSKQGIFISLQDDENLKISFNGEKLDGELLKELKAKKQELIVYLKQHRKVNTSYQPIPLAEPAADYKLSSAQLRLWILSQTEAGSLAYNIPGELRLKQVINVPAFIKAIKATVGRHEVLRTVFKENEDGEVRQLVLNQEQINFNVDYQDFREQLNNEEAVAKYIASDSTKAFNLAHGPLFRAALLQLADEEFILYFNIHHIISDGWSMNILSRDIFTLYKSFEAKTSIPLQALSIQYKDYAAWQLSELRSEAFESHKSYWLKQLAGGLPVIDLPTTKKRPAIRTYNGKKLTTYIDAPTTKRLKDFLQANGGSSFMGLLAVWKLLVFRYTSATDIITGTVVAGREHADLEEQIGCYINTLVLRNTIDPDESFTTFYERLKLNTLKAYDHQMYPFDQLVRDLELKWDLSRSLVFDAKFTYEKLVGKAANDRSNKHGQGLVTDAGNAVSKSDLELKFLEYQGGLSFEMIYNVDVYDLELMERAMKHYKQLLVSVLDKPKSKLSEIDYLSEIEKKQLLIDFNNSKYNFPVERHAIDLFSEQVALHPDRIAVYYEGDFLDYKTLDERSNQLANYLQEQQQVTRGSKVALLLNRSVEMVVAILRVLKVGACYIPIDTSLPNQRVYYMLKQGEASLLIADTADAQHYTSDCAVVQLEDTAIWACSSAVANIELAITDTAYCIFTSGSSGQPKGVMINHKSLFNLVKSFEKTVYCNYGLGLRLSLLASYAFDASIKQLFGSLLLGHSLYIADDTSRADGQALLNFFNQHQIAVSEGTPTHVRILLNSLKGGERLPHFHGWIIGGEAFDKSLASQFYERFGIETDLYNFYGPTETCVNSTYFKVTPADLPNYPTIPIGKPLLNERVYVTDHYGSLVPIGVEGELCIAGAGLGEGYIGNEELTATRFAKNWLSWEDRVYRTGDRVKWLANGNLAYCGRADHQVKLRGYRIELAEIEYHFNNITAVTQAVVVLQEQAGEKLLVGYYESTQELPFDVLRDHLAEHIPSYMIPSFFVYMEEWPVNVSGKLDRKLLPLPNVTIQQYTAPENDIEEQLVQTWANVLQLKVDAVSVSHSFFQLGGNSLKAMELLNYIRKHFSIKLSLSDILQNQTIRLLAKQMMSLSKEKVDSIPQAEEAAYYPLSSEQHRMYFLYEYNASSLAYNSTKVVKLIGQLDKKRLQKAFGQLVLRHECLRTTFQLIDGNIMQQISEEVAVEIDYVEQTDQVTTQITDFIKPFDLTNGPLFRIRVITLHAEEHILIVDNHHIISDIISSDLLLQDLVKLYGGEQLSKLLLQYKDYAVWQNESQQESLVEQKEYWLNEFKSSIPTLDILTSYTRPSIKRDEGGLYEIPISSVQTAKLKALASKEGVTLFSLFLSIYTILLSKLSNQEDIVVGIPVSGRVHPDLEGIAGLFMNTLALRNYAQADLAFNHFLNNVHACTIGGLENQAYPYGELVDALQARRDASRNPLFDVFFNYVNSHKAMAMDNPYFKIEPFAQSYLTTKFDLSLNVIEVGQDVRLSFSYRKDLYHEEMIKRFAHYLHSITTVISAQHEITLGQISILPLEEYELVVETFNHTLIDFPEKTVLDLFKAHVEENPTNTALLTNGTCLSYQDLDDRSDYWAAYLLKEGVKKGDPIGLYMKRSPEIIIGILAAMKVGAAYIPMDTQQPVARTIQMITESAVQVVLTHIKEAQVALELHSKVAQISELDAHQESITHEHYPTLEDAAYIMYTSGSTGRAKGCIVTHKNLANYIAWSNSYYFNESVDGNWGLMTSMVFDLSVTAIFTSLTRGKKLYLAEEQEDILQSLEEVLQHPEIDTVKLTPTHISLLQGSTLKETKVQTVICGGEQLTKQHIQVLKSLNSEVKIYNEYGPTEATVGCVATEVTLKDEFINIGSPISNTQCYIVNKQGLPQAIGVQGELLIGGAQVTSGYLNRESLTTEKFIPNRFSKHGVLYRTGDLAKWNTDGTITYLGRLDDQVKLNGVRIELGEIEFYLNEHPALSHVAVVLHEIKGQQELVAYYTSAEKVSRDRLRNYLWEHLPMSMIPNYYVQIDKFPTTTTGKLARKQLPHPHLAHDNYVGPTNEIEEKLVAIWAEVLKRPADQIGVATDFFELGGHSLKMIFLANKLKKIFEVTVSIKQLMEHATIRKLGNYLLRQESESHSPIPIAAPATDYPLSSAQQRMYFLYEYNKQSTAYNSLQVVKLTGQLDQSRLEHAFQQLVARHESLRTSFFLKDGVPVQQVLEDVDFTIDHLGRVVDVPAEIARFVRPFDLSQAPLLRASLIELSTTTHLLLVDNHHIISDGVTNGLLLSDFMSFYKGDRLPALKLHYKDYAVWQQSPKHLQALEQQKAFWLATYADEIPILDLPIDFPRTETKTNAGKVYDIAIDAKHLAKLTALAQEHQTTMFMMLYSIYTILLSKLSGTEDMVVGTSVAGRHHTDLEHIAGVFINALALRSKPAGQLSYLDYLNTIKKEVLTAFDHQEYPYERLVDALNLRRDTSRPPLFNVMFEYFNFDQPKVEIPDLAVSPYKYDVGVSRFDLTLRIFDNIDHFRLSFQYSTELFEDTSIERFGRYFQQVLAAIVSDTSIAIKDIEILSEAEKAQYINNNKTVLVYDDEVSLPAIFSAQAALHPNRTAVYYEGESLTYSELEARSNQLAHYLQANGILHGGLVGLLLDRSIDMIVGILGVLKSGAGYVPIDPDLPKKRVDYMLKQSQAVVLLAESAYKDRFSTSLPVVGIQDAAIWDSATTDFDAGLTKDDVAYCIFTSGSSGKPKGVMMSHGSVYNLVKGLEQTVYNNDEPGLRISLLASYVFDASVQQIFGSLLLGHSLYIANDESRKSGQALLSFYNENKIAVSDGTPTHLRMLLNSLQGNETLKQLQGWILAGEYLDKVLVSRFYDAFGTSTDLYNFYGPTETCVDSTYFKISPSDLLKYATLPIGKPLPNERVYVTDAYGKLVAPGVLGELCIAGAGLGKCYIGNQKLTSECFVRDWVEGESVVYRTGDLVRWLPDGNLEYAGRIDEQVKLRGYRIELAEIAYQLETLDEIKQSVVVLQEREGEQVLVAYYESAVTLETGKLRDSLSKTLPAYMLPSYYVQLEKLPVNISGKLAKQELPSFDIELGQQHVSPSNETERSLVLIWATVLKIDSQKIGVATDFFELGGHSLNGMQLIDTINRQFKVDLKLVEIFKRRTIKELAELIEMNQWLGEKADIAGKEAVI